VSRQNVEIVRRAIELYAHGSTHRAAVELLHPEITVRVRIGEVYEGRDAAVAFFRDWHDSWEDFFIEVEEFFDTGDQVVVFLRQRGQGRISGIAIDQRPAVVVRLKGGQIIDWTTYVDRAQALEAAGLQG
jgi:ketosteroid isomerase-like protein